MLRQTGPEDTCSLAWLQGMAGQVRDIAVAGTAAAQLRGHAQMWTTKYLPHASTYKLNAQGRMEVAVGVNSNKRR